MWSAVVILSSTRVIDKAETLEESSHPQESGKQWRHDIHPPACTCTQQLLAPCIAWRNYGLSRFKSPLPPNLQCRPVRSHSLPVVVRRHHLLPGRRFLWLIGHVEVPGSNNPSVQSTVVPASDSGPEPSVE
ncbi:hypothetical protein BU17DRAFT_101633 [Hysterangium stoloniferum]|nr:hypothetical protein BU17DRAFT_102627 [Hysterangium stoloniferum]KAF8503916.1 hypothetical protein BU17DRAFT_101633 [Hysterangium stoloniferum]